MRKKGTTQNEVFLGFVSVCLFSTMLLILGVQESLHFLAENINNESHLYILLAVPRSSQV